MIEEIHLWGVYLPAALAWCMLAAILMFALRPILQRMPVDRLLWNPGLLDLALFFLLWWGLGAYADRLPAEWFMS